MKDIIGKDAPEVPDMGSKEAIADFNNDLEGKNYSGDRKIIVLD